MRLKITLGIFALSVGAGVIGYQYLDTQNEDQQFAASESVLPTMTVYKSASCGCCANWVEHLEKNGFNIKVENTNNLMEIKQQYAVPNDLMSCHTGIIDGFAIEGHVPAEDIKSYLASHQSEPSRLSIGLAVPGMPRGAPGMEMPGFSDSYEVLEFYASGDRDAFSSYGG